MKWATLTFSVCMALMGMAILAAPAEAQATRTWVSGVGDDANPCSRTAPCKTFAGAISKTAASGEINCLDPGGFGALTITKAITISCQLGPSGVLVSGTNGLVVAAGVNDVVVLDGLDIDGVGNGLAGIQFNSGAALLVRRCIIYGFQSAGSGFGIKFSPNAASTLNVEDTAIFNNGNGTTGGGIFVQPAAGGSAKATLNRVNVSNNVLGVRADGTGSTATINVTIVDSDVSTNTNAGVTAFSPSGGASSKVVINRTTISGNGTGVNANGAGAFMDIGASVITFNTTGVAISNSATMASYQNNQISFNPTPGPTIPTTPLQ